MYDTSLQSYLAHAFHLEPIHDSFTHIDISARHMRASQNKVYEF